MSKIHHNHQKINSKQIQIIHPSLCLNTIHLTNSSHILAVKGAGDRVKHFTNIQNKGRRNVHEVIFTQPNLLFMLLETPSGVALIHIIYI